MKNIYNRYLALFYGFDCGLEPWYNLYPNNDVIWTTRYYYGTILSNEDSYNVDHKFVAPSLPFTSCRDTEHGVMILRSPEFLLYDGFRISAYLAGGTNQYVQTTMWDVIPEGTASSYYGPAALVLRRVSDNKIYSTYWKI